jgi:hypothetical protein
LPKPTITGYRDQLLIDQISLPEMVGSPTRHLSDNPFFNFLLNALFTKKIPGNCSVHSKEYICKNLSQIEMSKIFDVGPAELLRIVVHYIR